MQYIESKVSTGLNFFLTKRLLFIKNVYVFANSHYNYHNFFFQSVLLLLFLLLFHSLFSIILTVLNTNTFHNRYIMFNLISIRYTLFNEHWCGSIISSSLSFTTEDCFQKKSSFYIWLTNLIQLQ